ncbi:hypothetical protein SNE40_015234 [Patella caerulea]|uniref:Arginine-glutamic acid dipeptide repeats protein n=1 Tax=Patella caerulea TaxID=87958 RepID=A0AAN8JLS9_PATCE
MENVLKENVKNSPVKKRKDRENKKLKEKDKILPTITANDVHREPGEVVLLAPAGRKGTKGRGSGYITMNEDQITSYTNEEGISFRVKDCVYIENKRPDNPFFICAVTQFRMTKRDTLVVDIKWYFRHSEVPYSVYTLLVQDRTTENKTGCDIALTDPSIKSRELFISDASDTYPVTSLRGKCKVIHYQDIYKARNFKAGPDTYFYVLSYSPESKRLANTQGEIRVGGSHQARLPEYKPNVATSDMPERLDKWEVIRWRPQYVMDGDLVMYLRAARSIAAFAGLCDGGSTEDGCQAASMDETTLQAMDVLHRHDYDTGKALQALVKSPALRSIDKKWTEDDSKRFVKGLKQYGKNFFKIRKELLPNKETGDLVEFYYFWKKTPGAASNRPHRRHRRPGHKRQIPRSNNQTPADLSSASECSDNDSDYSIEGSGGGGRDITNFPINRNTNNYFCRHCNTTTSKDWHHAGKDKSLLCTDCRMFFKKYGEDRPLDSPQDTGNTFLFKPVKEEEDDEDGKHNMRTRRNNNNTGGNNKGKKKERGSTSSPDNIDGIINGNSDPSKNSDRKSPSVGSTCSNSSTDKESKDSNISDKKEDSEKSLKRHNITESETKAKKKKSQDRSDCDSVSDSSSISGNDDIGNDVDEDDNNQDELSSSTPPTTPTPSEVDYQPLKDLVKPEPQHPVQSPLHIAHTLPPKPLHMPEPHHYPSLPIQQTSQNSSFHHPHLPETSLPLPPTTSAPSQTQHPKPEEMVDKKPDIASLQQYTAMYPLTPTHATQPGGPPPIPGLIPIKKEPLSPRHHMASAWKEVKNDSDIPNNVTNKFPSHRENSFTGLPYPSHSISSVPPAAHGGALPEDKPERRETEIVKPIHHVAPSSIASIPPHQHLPQDMSLQSNLFNPRPAIPELKPTPISSSSSSKDTTTMTAPPMTVTVDPDEDDETDLRPPSPDTEPPTPCNKEFHKSASAIFIQILNRGKNSCSRSDYVFKPLPDSKLAKKREDRERKTAHVQPMKEEKKRMETPPRTTSADAQVTSSISHSQHSSGYSERHTPHPYSDTPALRQLHEYARPHAMGQDMRTPYGMGMHSPMDPFYRLALYPPGSRERLELELERDKRERDARERELRERELREIELREKMKAEMEMKPPGLDRLLPPGANPLDPHWLELQRRYGYPPGMAMVGHPGASGSGGHIPGVYPPTSLANDLMQREREKLERLGIPSGLHQINPEAAGPPAGYPYGQGMMDRLQAERLQVEQLSMSGDPVARMQQMGMASRAAAALAAHHTHAHSHTHLHLHQQQDRLLGLQQLAANHALYPNMQPPPGADPLTGLPSTSGSGSNPAISLAGVPPPVSQALLSQCNSRDQELLQRELYNRAAYMDPALAHQLSAQAAHHEALQRHMLERDRFGASGHLPH